ncbi:putative RNA helicase [Tetragenococcus halophilus subsp. halophilus]|uniref:DEAD/DEAH box helicase n=1 Tax=Tetragenococcus halophilus TaxID=51669 RepID=UPI000CBDA5CE|nr:DEAD/DEAH box helicase [Tetragenococcus halophilus]MCO8285304.1 DEAD/DEAH box helicase [Tetragenococcus halophilus]GBD65706.1 putative RNA helicase [Tetragenococcus halophilus subsp. halophilus]GBD78585.1 putative RNA helicase [Tetragenococcus halophilus subsp. halophilus]
MEEQFLPEIWQERIKKEGFEQTSLIQEKVFSALYQGKSLVGVAPTGTGKTLAYLWPTLLKLQPKHGNQLLIVTPSQELGVQVADVARPWALDLNLQVQSLIGGANKKRQIEKLKKKPEVLIGTPGRLVELIKEKKLKAANIQTVILDEADQLLQKEAVGFMQTVIKSIPNTSQYAFFSATATKALPAIKQLFQQEFPVIDVSKEDKSHQQVAHYYLVFPTRRKVDALRSLGHLTDFQGLIFFNEVQDLGSAEEKLRYHKLPVASLASDKSKLSRKDALEKFRKQQLTELLSTDVASRGLDIADLYYVVNAEVPSSKESYLHRAGRIGRMGKTGTVITIVQEDSLPQLKKITKSLELSLQEIYLYEGQLTTEKPKAQPIKKKKTAKSQANKSKKSKKKTTKKSQKTSSNKG